MSTTAIPKQVDKPEAIKNLPYLGSMLSYFADPFDYMDRIYKLHGPVSEQQSIGQKFTAIVGHEACNEALLNKDKAFANEPGWGELVGPFFNRGLMLLDFAEHKAHRRLMQEAFTRARLESYTKSMAPVVETGIPKWQPNAKFEAYPALKEFTLELATQVFMGMDFSQPHPELVKVNQAFVDCVQAATSFVRYPLPFTRWGRATKGRRILEEFFNAQLPEKKANPGSDLFSVLANLTQDGESFSDTDVVNHMIFLLMAAHDTTTTTVSTLMLYLGKNQQWQDRLRAGALAVNDPGDLAELDQLTDFDLAIKEALRLVPPVPSLIRRTIKDTEFMGHKIPADQMVSIMVLHQHLDPKLWTNPLEFDPLRFSEPRREDKLHRHAWEPFGGGVHKCLGMIFANLEVKQILIQILRSYRWDVPADYQPKMNNLSLPVPKDGLPLNLQRL